ncbi:MAG: hypothetical protein SGPRY_006635 [Prymnesium sp.]
MKPPLHPLLEEQLEAAGCAHPTSDGPLRKLLEQVSLTYARVECAHRLVAPRGCSTNKLPALRTDVSGAVVEWNDQLIKLTGCLAEECVGKQLVSLSATEARSGVHRMLESVLQGNVRCEVDRAVNSVLVPMVSSLGKRVELTLGASPHYDVRGDVVGMLADNQCSELTLLQDVLDSTSVALVCVDAQGRIQHWNRQLETLSGYSKKKMLGNLLSDVAPFSSSASHHSSPAHVSELLGRALLGEQVKGVDLAVRDVRGAGMMMQMSASPLSGGAGVVLAGVDVTAERQLGNEQLVIDRAREAKESKGRFLGAMSHELRTPLNGLLGSLELALQRSRTAELMVPIRHATTAARHLHDMLNDLLSLSAIEAGTLELERQVFSLTNLLSSLHSQLEQRARSKDLKFESILDENVPALALGDRHRIEQVLHHLCDNALQFTKVGGFSLKADVVSQESEHILLRFTVADTGIGIKEEHQKIVFSLFSSHNVKRTSSAQRGIRPGAGLGLSICRELVELMGGEITCSSEYGCGSSFVATVMLELPEVSSISWPEKAKSPQCAWEGKTVLVVEDDELNSWVVGSMLEADGYRVMRTSDGTEAIEVLKRSCQLPGSASEKAEIRKVDLILMDCCMPTLDGFMTTALIRLLESAGNKEKSHVPIVALTAYALSSDREKCLRAGMDAYLTKPVGRAALLKAVRNSGRLRVSSRAQELPPNGQLIAEYQERLHVVADAVLQAIQGSKPAVAALEASQLSALCVLPQLKGMRDIVAKMVNDLSASAEASVEQNEELISEVKQLKSGIVDIMRGLTTRTVADARPTHAPVAPTSVSPPLFGDRRTDSRTQGLSAAMPAAAQSIPLPAMPSDHAPSTAPPAALDPQPPSATEPSPVPSKPHATPSAPSAPSPESSSCIRLNDAVANIGGDMQMTMRLLVKFRDHAGPTQSTFKEALESESISVLRREAHSLKGSSGYIAAGDLRQAAMQLQEAADRVLNQKTPVHELSFYVDQVEKELLRAVDDINIILRESEQQGAITPPETDSAFSTMQKHQLVLLPLHNVHRIPLLHIRSLPKRVLLLDDRIHQQRVLLLDDRMDPQRVLLLFHGRTPRILLFCNKANPQPVLLLNFRMNLQPVLLLESSTSQRILLLNKRMDPQRVMLLCPQGVRRIYNRRNQVLLHCNNPQRVLLLDKRMNPQQVPLLCDNTKSSVSQAKKRTRQSLTGATLFTILESAAKSLQDAADCVLAGSPDSQEHLTNAISHVHMEQQRLARAITSRVASFKS